MLNELLERTANELAEAANECCYRSDRWKEQIRERILESFKEVVEVVTLIEREACAKVPKRKEYMDIVDRLRNHALPDPHDEREVLHAPLLREAANEIERLRKDAERLIVSNEGGQAHPEPISHTWPD